MEWEIGSPDGSATLAVAPGESKVTRGPGFRRCDAEPRPVSERLPPMSKPRSVLLGVVLVVLATVVGACGLLPFGALMPSGGAPPMPVGTPTAAVRADLADHLAQWRARGLASYGWTVSFGCECSINGPLAVTVTGGVPVKAVTQGAVVVIRDVSAFPLTVDALYVQAIAALDGGGTVTVTWGDGGIPTRILIDPIPNAIDDELTVTVTAFAAAP